MEDEANNEDSDQTKDMIVKEGVKDKIEMTNNNNGKDNNREEVLDNHIDDEDTINNNVQEDDISPKHNANEKMKEGNIIKSYDVEHILEEKEEDVILNDNDEEIKEIEQALNKEMQEETKAKLINNSEDIQHNRNDNDELIAHLKDIEQSNEVNKAKLQLKEEIIQYLTGKYIYSNPDINDISYDKWVSKDTNIQALCKEIEIPLRMKFNKLIDSHDFDCEFKLLKWITQDKLHRDQLITLAKEDYKLNRFLHILPYKHNQITLNKEGEEENSQYINASYIDGPLESNRKLFIATQNPLAHTKHHFFQLIQSKNVKVIIQLMSEYEESRYYAESYIPNEDRKIKQIKQYSIEVLDTPTILIEKALIYNKIQITNKDTNTITQVDYLLVSCWDEHTSIRPEIEKMLFNVLFEYVDKCSIGSPCIVHCIDGVGRTGVFISLYNIYKCINEQKKANFEVPIINVFNVVRCLREQRIGMVFNSVQYQNIYKIALDFNKHFYGEEELVFNDISP